MSWPGLQEHHQQLHETRLPRTASPARKKLVAGSCSDTAESVEVEAITSCASWAFIWEGEPGPSPLLGPLKVKGTLETVLKGLLNELEELKVGFASKKIQAMGALEQDYRQLPTHPSYPSSVLQRALQDWGSFHGVIRRCL